MRDYKSETKKRVDFIQNILQESGAKGIVFGNSGGKDATLVGILCKFACENTLGLLLPCGSTQNYNADMSDALAVSAQYGVDARKIDLKAVSYAMKLTLAETSIITESALANIAPRLRMTALYAVAASEGRLVAGTGNRSERYMGYFTKWGDGAFDFNPIADLTVTEIYEFLKHLGAPESIIDKAPSAGLYDGQTDEGEMGVSYKSIDMYLIDGYCPSGDLEIISKYHRISEHKRNTPAIYGE